MALKVLFAASELTPLAKVGGLGDVVGSLPKALHNIGIDAKIIIPRYEQIDKNKLGLKELNQFSNITVDGEKIKIYKTTLPKSRVEVFLIENDTYLSRGPVYFEKTAFAGSPKEIDRFIFFSKAVFALLQDNNFFRPDIVHCNDWHTAALVKLIKKSNLGIKTVYTIHNLANQGAVDGTNWMAEGIKNADIVTTVSETYAKEIQTKKFGAGLENLLKKRAKEGKLKGILNGIDYDFWKPRKKDKANFQNKLGLKKDAKAPLFGLVSRLTYQKGLRMLLPLIDDFVSQGAQFVFLGQGESEVEKGLEKAAKNHPDMVYTKIGFDAELANKIYANVDFFLMPSRFEPSGLGQMIAMRYGAIPIVRATGGLKDSVKHLKTGFVFKEEKAIALKKAMEKAMEIFNEKPKQFEKITANCKKEDFSWKRSAKKYKQMYSLL